MFGMTGLNELLILMLVIAVLSMTGLWPRIMDGLRDLRGDSRGGNGSMSPQETEMCFKILGLSTSAKWPEIEQAYRRKAKVHHPDVGGDEDAMRALNDAYAVLKRHCRR